MGPYSYTHPRTYDPIKPTNEEIERWRANQPLPTWFNQHFPEVLGGSFCGVVLILLTYGTIVCGPYGCGH